MHKSATCIFGINLRATSKRDEWRLTFKKSIRGSIRKSPSVMTWVQSLSNLSTWGETDTPGLVKDWNRQAAVSDRLVGGKAQAVQLIMENMPKKVFQKVINHVSRFGWDFSMLSDDCMTSKKLYPGSIFRHNKPGWQTRLAVTEHSMELMFDYCLADWLSKMPALRRKVTRKDLEDMAELASLVSSIYTECIKTTPLKPEVSHLPSLGHSVCARNVLFVFEYSIRPGD